MISSYNLIILRDLYSGRQAKVSVMEVNSIIEKRMKEKQGPSIIRNMRH